VSVDRGHGDPQSDPIDNLAIHLRAYITRPPKTDGKRKLGSGRKPAWLDQPRQPPSDWVLIFDCETRTTPDQRLRFGAYQLRYKGKLWERGVFYEPEVLSRTERAVLRAVIDDERGRAGGERVCLRTRAEFVDKVFYEAGYLVGAQIVGFNLPFDLSRLAVRHAAARRSMRGGFSLTLAEARPAVIVKHLSRRAAMIRFQGPRRPKEEPDDDPDPSAPHEVETPATPDRGYFVDVKTLAAALTSKTHSLAALSETLSVPTVKTDSDDHGETLSPEYVRYGLNDVQTTWECFENLTQRLASFRLAETGAYDLYSEASLGKAYLRTMNVKPWREVQPDFPPVLIGNILSAYFGGRAEVHIRRQITPVIHCDFLSMYPTVYTLMGLWNFVRAEGVSYRSDLSAIRSLLTMSRSQLVELLRGREGWQELAALVQVAPRGDLFPVRAQYPDSDVANIGLNYLTSDEVQWFTLADVIASKVLTGKEPEIVAAIRFEPKKQQHGLKPIEIEGETIDPSSDDFYRRLIIHRNALKARAKVAGKAEKAALNDAQQGVKILANATSYGIFVELNVEDYRVAKPRLCHGSGPRPFKFKSKRFEKPGSFFHPLLATLITGAARLMLALAEHQVIEQGLDWAFCDTDSIAIANTNELPLDDFKARAFSVRDWFKELNPYGQETSILQLEDVNFPIGKAGNIDLLDPPNCLAVSAKRYVLYNGSGDQTVVRKASGHGLGHLVGPYEEPAKKRRERIEQIGVPRWQEDVWKEIIHAAESGSPDQTRFMDMPGFDVPAASQYAATTPELLRWFDGYNELRGEGKRIFPFGFLLSLQSKSRMEMAKDEPEALANPLWQRRDPRPASPYFRDLRQAADHAFDRERDETIPESWLKSLARSLIRYDLHPETKFRGGDYDQRGLLQRRHVFALAHQMIGKEADHIDESELMRDDAGAEQFPAPTAECKRLAAYVFDVQESCGMSDRELTEAAKVSPHTLRALRRGMAISNDSLAKMVRAAEAERHAAVWDSAKSGKWLEMLRVLISAEN
jgi:hypothetical protein